MSPLVRLLGFSPRDAVEFFGTPSHIIRPHLPETLDDDVGECPVDGVVHVEAGWEEKGDLAPVNETIWLEQLEATQRTKIKAIVAYADLSLGDRVSDVLKGHLAASSKVRSIRQTLSWHPDSSILNGAQLRNFRSAVRCDGVSPPD